LNYANVWLGNYDHVSCADFNFVLHKIQWFCICLVNLPYVIFLQGLYLVFVLPLWFEVGHKNKYSISNLKIEMWVVLLIVSNTLQFTLLP